MHRVKYIYFLLLIQYLLPHICNAWRPIVGVDFVPAYKTPTKLDSASVTPQTALLSDLKTVSLQRNSVTSIPFNFDQDGLGYTSNYAGTANPTRTLLGEDHCIVKKYAFNHDGIAQYNNPIPEMEQFTACFWMRFTNHSGDHVILTYSVDKDPRELQFWVANAKNSSFLSMAIKGQQVYRLNYPLRVRQWHHTCSSWNGKTGEWQVWLKSERIGRGFHNSLVGHKIPANGKLFSGGSSNTGEISQGLHFEITLLQIYRIALSAGKAHRDHKHHHAHHFDHEGQELATTTKSPITINRPISMHSLLANGQIPTRVKINLAQPSQLSKIGSSVNVAGISTPNLSGIKNFPSLPEGQTIIHTNFVNGQINSGSRILTEQLLGFSTVKNEGPVIGDSGTSTHVSQTNSPNGLTNVQYVDETETRVFFKRQAQLNDTKSQYIRVQKKKARNEIIDKNIKKREFVLLEDGTVVDDLALGIEYKYDGLAEFGGKTFKHNLTTKMNLADEITEYDREPAEEEVKAVMALCTNCDIEPFEGAIVFAWKNVQEELDNALKGYSVGKCGNF